MSTDVESDLIVRLASRAKRVTLLGSHAQSMLDYFVFGRLTNDSLERLIGILHLFDDCGTLSDVRKKWTLECATTMPDDEMLRAALLERVIRLTPELAAELSR